MKIRIQRIDEGDGVATVSTEDHEGNVLEGGLHHELPGLGDCIEVELEPGQSIRVG